MSSSIQETFEQQLNDLIKDFKAKKKKYYTSFKNISLSIAIVSAAIAFCLGISFVEQVAVPFKIIALILSSILSVLSSAITFLNYKNEYVQRTKTLVQLLSLRRQYHLHRDNITKEEILGFSNKLENIMLEDLNHWAETLPYDKDGE